MVLYVIWEKVAFNVASTCGAFGNNSFVLFSGELIDVIFIVVVIGLSKDVYLVVMNVCVMDLSMGMIMLIEFFLAFRSVAT